MPNLTVSATIDSFMAAADAPAARVVLGLGALSTVTPGTGVAAALAVNVGSAGAPVLFNGALGTPSSGNIASCTGYLANNLGGLGTGVFTALSQNVGSPGAVVTFNGAAGTPSTITLTNGTGLPISTGLTGSGTGVLTALAVNVGTAGAFVVNGGALGTPSSGVVTNLTGTGSFNTTGSAATLTTTRTIGGSNFNGSANVTDFPVPGNIGNNTPATSLAVSGTSTLGMTTATSGSFPPFESVRTSALTNAVQSAMSLKAVSSGKATDGFGTSVLFRFSDTGGTDFALATVEGFRSGADNSGALSFNTYLAGTRGEAARILPSNKFLLGYTADQNTGLLQINGGIGLDKTITPAGTTGARTINKPAGSVNFAAAATSLVVTNSLVTANSVIQATIGNDSTAKSVTCVAAAGSFTLRPGAAPTGEVRVDFLVIN